MADTCECGNELLGSINCGELLDWLTTEQLLKKDFAAWRKYLVLLHIFREMCCIAYFV